MNKSDSYMNPDLPGRKTAEDQPQDAESALSQAMKKVEDCLNDITELRDEFLLKTAED